ncbi:MAG: type II toxin-antitoxin system prevent-host-death family antitoxin [Deltaproteobacteria bacterium]|nr:type II toxin-antitoxin system prevent-host-death family antitoxin [Deltaproteobacteria bacterium]
MLSVNATDLRGHLFSILKKVSKGEVVAIRWNGKEVGRLVPARKGNWRDKIRVKAKMLQDEEKVFAPLDDLWEDYR